MRIIFRFLASVYFAVILIGITLVLTLIGTIIESCTNSHVDAAKWTTSSFLFKTLLWLFFVNILFAAVRRWPFKKQHLAFVLAHLGLLMILSGVLIKSYFGLQGELILTEGEASRYFFLKNTYALYYETPLERYLVPLKEGYVGQLMQFEIIHWIPNCEEKYQRWFKNGELDLLNIGKTPLSNFNEIFTAYLKAPLAEGEDPWHVYGITSLEMPDISYFQNIVEKPALIFIQDQNGEERLYAMDNFGNTHTQHFPSDKNPSLLVFNKGYKGYAVYAELPPKFSKKEKPIELATLLLRECISASVKTKEDSIPAITLKLSDKTNDLITLPFDKYGSALKWPTLDGKALLRFQPMQSPLPFTIKLLEGRKIEYPDSDASFSYESDIRLIQNGKDRDITLSMNKVYESKEGYRFYMSSLQIPNYLGAKKVLIVVSRDPAKYYLTYPGGVIVTLAILLLLNHRKKREIS